MEIKLSSILTDNDLIEFDLYTKKSASKVDDLKLLKNLEASSELINFIIREQEWRGYQYGSGLTIGYGTTELLNDIGLTGSSAIFPTTYPA